MCPLIELWLKTEIGFSDIDFTATSSLQQALPANPMRFCILAGNTQAVILNGGFGTTPPTNPVFMFGTGTPGLLMSRDVIGDLITQPLWLKSSGTSIFTTIHELSYNPRRFALAMRMIDEYLSRQ